MRLYVLVMMGMTGCLKPDLVECSDGTLCPSGTACDVENATCIDPEGLSVAPGEINGVKVTPEEATIAPHDTLQAIICARGATESMPGTPIEVRS